MSMHAVPRPGGENAAIRSSQSERKIEKNLDILRFGERPQAARLLLTGFACHYQMLSDGRRQITNILVPGDICDLEASASGPTDYAVGTLSPCTVRDMPPERLDGDELYHLLRRDVAIARQRIVTIGQRLAVERIAHLFCELNVRMSHAGLATNDSFEFLICQSDLADALGLSTVHVNRSLQDLRKRKLIRLDGRRLTIIDRPALESLALFDPTYLRMRDS